MKAVKKIISILLSVSFIILCFAGCKAESSEKYNSETVIIGYTEEAAPFIQLDKDGKATGFVPELWELIFNDVKGELKNYVFEKVDKGYRLEDDGQFFDSKEKEYSAALLMGAVHKNDGTFNEDYSFTAPIITNRIVSLVAKDSKIKTYADFEGARAVVVSDAAKTAFEQHKTIYSACKNVEQVGTIDEAFALVDSKKADVIVTDEFSLMPSEKADSYTRLNGELDVIEYVIACAKYSGWKDSINEAIREKKSMEYNDADEFTPIVEKYFNYNASSFNYETETDKK